MTVPLPPSSPDGPHQWSDQVQLPAGFTALRADDPAAVGPFQLVGRIGAGGMGVVYGALDGHGDHIAVKVIHPGHALDPASRAGFAREADLLSRIDAECAPTFLGADTTGKQPWLATEFIHGDTLRQHIDHYGPLSGPALTAFAAGTAEALTGVHAAGVVHRDIKPANVILGLSGPRVLDFGIARASDDTTPEEGVYGTPGWVAPERLGGETATAAADVFAWGALVAFAATGRNPFGTGESAALLRRTREGRADVDGVPDELLPLVGRALLADPGARPTAAEALDAVLATVPDDPDATRPDPRVRLRSLLNAAWHGFGAAGRGAGPWVAATAVLSASAGGVGAGSAAAGGAAAAGAGAGAAGGAAGGGAGAAGAGAAGAGTIAGMSKGMAAAVAGITATAVVTGGWVGGRMLTDQPVIPGAQADPSPSAEPSPTRPAYPQSVDFRSMTVGFPADWNVQRVEEDFSFFAEDGPMPADWLAVFPGGGSCDTEISWTLASTTGCEHIKILGPEGIGQGGPGLQPIDAQTYYVPSTNVPLCPEGAELQPFDPAEQGAPPEPELRPIGDLKASYNEYDVPCTDTGSGQFESSYRQRLWLLPESEILIVDNIGIQELDEMLAQARME